VLSVPPDDPAVQASRVEYDSTGMAKIVAYLARPKAAGTYPGVLVIHENRGLNDHIRDVARRLAKANFVALAPDLTSRGGSTEKLDPDMARAYLSMDGIAQTLLDDMNAGVEYLAKVMDVGAKLGVVGFCFGGGQTYRVAISNPKLAAAVPYYGPATPEIIAGLKDSKAAFLLHHADMDTNVNSTRDQISAALMAAGKTFEIVVHPGTRHAFNNDTGANYNEAETVAAWTKTLEWFRTYLK
jgi:carboxymethylenebutenolidase